MTIPKNKSMKPTLSFEKVFENERQRFYKLSTSVNKAPNSRYVFSKEREYNLDRVSEAYKKYLPEAIEYVCISDAHTHTERLMFLAMKYKEDNDVKYSCLPFLHLDGKHTFLIDGGNKRHVHPDEVYLRRLATVNGYQYVK